MVDLPRASVNHVHFIGMSTTRGCLLTVTCLSHAGHLSSHVGILCDKIISTAEMYLLNGENQFCKIFVAYL